MSSENVNLRLWDEVKDTPEEMKTEMENRNYLTNINSYWSFRRATEMFGPYGIGWGLKDESFDYPIEGIVHLRAIFFYNYDGKKGEFPISVGYDTHKVFVKGQDPKPNCECLKSARTEAIGKALSMLGFSYDVYGQPKGERKKGASKGSTDGTPKFSKNFNSKYGSEDKPAMCKFCGEKHIKQGNPVCYYEPGDGKRILGATSCRERAGKAQPEEPAAKTKTGIDGMERKEMLDHIREGEGRIADGDVVAIKEMRLAVLGSEKLSSSNTDEIRTYLKWLAENYKAGKGAQLGAA